MKTKTFFRALAWAGLMMAAGQLTAMWAAEPAAATADAADPFWPAEGIFPVPGKTSSWVGFRAKNVERRTLFAQRKQRDLNGVVFVGDSIFEGWHTLAEDCAGAGVKLVNRGIGGDTLPNLIYRLEDDVLSLNPRGLVILIGTNDLSEHMTPELIAGNFQELHRRIRARYPELPVAWCCVMPRRGEDNYPELVRDLNRRIAALVASDPRSTLCDTFTPLALPDGSSKPECFLSDRLHPNAAGFAALKDAIYPVLAGWNLARQ